MGSKLMKLLNKVNYPITGLLSKIEDSDPFPFTLTYFLAKRRYLTRSKPPDTIAKVGRLAMISDGDEHFSIGLVCD